MVVLGYEDDGASPPGVRIEEPMPFVRYKMAYASTSSSRLGFRQVKKFYYVVAFEVNLAFPSQDACFIAWSGYATPASTTGMAAGGHRLALNFPWCTLGSTGGDKLFFFLTAKRLFFDWEFAAPFLRLQNDFFDCNLFLQSRKNSRNLTRLFF